MKILKQLSEAMGVSGAEYEVRGLILGLIEKHVDEISTDTMGNIIARKKGKGRNRMTVMIDAHMDEVGMMVTGYTGRGLLKVVSVGGLDARMLQGTRVLVGKKKTPGVIGATPIHLVESMKVVPLKSMGVDIGEIKKDSIKDKVKIGTRIGFDSEFMEVGGMARGKAFDNRVGCAVLVHLLQADPYSFDLVAAFTVQEEVGLRGARIAAHKIKPDMAFVLEGTIADDLPKDEDEDISSTTEVGKGPALSMLDRSVIYDRRINDYLLGVAKENKIPIQMKQPGIGGTDGGAIVTQLEGIPAAAVSVPCRYIHSPSAMLSKRDYRNTIKLMENALRGLNRGILKR